MSGPLAITCESVQLLVDTFRETSERGFFSDPLEWRGEIAHTHDEGSSRCETVDLLHVSCLLRKPLSSDGPARLVVFLRPSFELVAGPSFLKDRCLKRIDQ